MSTILSPRGRSVVPSSELATDPADDTLAAQPEAAPRIAPRTVDRAVQASLSGLICGFLCGFLCAAFLSVSVGLAGAPIGAILNIRGRMWAWRIQEESATELLPGVVAVAAALGLVCTLGSVGSALGGGFVAAPVAAILSGMWMLRR